MTYKLPENLQSLHFAEEDLRTKALVLLAADAHLQRHIDAVEASMDLADVLRQFDTLDEDLKVIQLLGMRTFNAFGSALKLALSGYSQKSAMIMRDVLETAFLLDLFRGDRSEIQNWRLTENKVRKRKYSPIAVRMKLDARYGDASKRRAEHYELLSELAGHASMQADLMLRPTPFSDAVIGPFLEAGVLQAVISELGRLAIMIGEDLDAFMPDTWERAHPSRLRYANLKAEWLREFYGVRAS